MHFSTSRFIHLTNGALEPGGISEIWSFVTINNLAQDVDVRASSVFP